MVKACTQPSRASLWTRALAQLLSQPGPPLLCHAGCLRQGARYHWPRYPAGERKGGCGSGLVCRVRAGAGWLAGQTCGVWWRPAMRGEPQREGWGWASAGLAAQVPHSPCLRLPVGAAGPRPACAEGHRPGFEVALQVGHGGTVAPEDGRCNGRLPGNTTAVAHIESALNPWAAPFSMARVRT